MVPHGPRLAVPQRGLRAELFVLAVGSAVGLIILAMIYDDVFYPVGLLLGLDLLFSGLILAYVLRGGASIGDSVILAGIVILMGLFSNVIHESDLMFLVVLMSVPLGVVFLLRAARFVVAVPAGLGVIVMFAFVRRPDDLFELVGFGLLVLLVPPAILLLRRLHRQIWPVVMRRARQDRVDGKGTR